MARRNHARATDRAAALLRWPAVNNRNAMASSRGVVSGAETEHTAADNDEVCRIAIKRFFWCASTPTYVVMFFTTGSFRMRL